MEDDNVPVKVKKTDDEIISKASAVLKVPKSEVISKALGILLKGEKDEGTKYTKLAEALTAVDRAGAPSEDVFEKMMKFRMLKEFDKGEGDFDLNKLLAFQAMRQMTQPDIAQQLMMQKMMAGEQKKGGEMDEFMKMYLQNAQTQQQAMMQMLFGKKMEEVESKINKTSTDFFTAMQLIEGKIGELKNTGGITEEMEKYSAFRDALATAADKAGLVQKEEITSKEGKIDWGKFANRVLGTFEKIGTKMAERPPAPQQVTLMPEAPMALGGGIQPKNVQIEGPSIVPEATPGIASIEPPIDSLVQIESTDTPTETINAEEPIVNSEEDAGETTPSGDTGEQEEGTEVAEAGAEGTEG